MGCTMGVLDGGSEAIGLGVRHDLGTGTDAPNVPIVFGIMIGRTFCFLCRRTDSLGSPVLARVNMLKL